MDMGYFGLNYILRYISGLLSLVASRLSSPHFTTTVPFHVLCCCNLVD